MDDSFDPKDIVAKTPLTVDGKEDDVISDIINRDIAEYLSDYGYSVMKLKTIFEGKKCSTNEQLRLNYVIKIISKKQRIPIKDIVLFFAPFAPIEKILYYIGDDVKSLLKKEYSYITRKGKKRVAKAGTMVKKKKLLVNNSFIKKKTHGGE